MDAPQRKVGFHLQEAIDTIDQGLLWLDEELRVEGHNAAYRHLLEIEGEDAFLGRPYADMLSYLLERGEFFDVAHEKYLAGRMASMRGHETLRVERVRPNGTALSVLAAPLSSGGYIYTYLDVTRERLARETQKRNAKATVVAMASFAEHRDGDTGIHVLRVARLVGQIARKLGTRDKFAAVIDEEFVEHVATASILHDVGKLATPDSILLKNGPLTPAEREIMQQHAVAGADMLKQARLTMGQSRYLDIGLEVALTHHECFDGRGYPHGTSGEDIPLSGRICAVADVFDALTSRRPYKQPWETSRAIELICQQRGSQFDPDVVDAFTEVIDERTRVCLIPWTDAFSVGNPQIGEQHAVLIDTINQLASAESLHNHHAVSMIIDELASYAAFHFSYEESLLERVGYPHLEEHRIMHQAYIQWVNELRDRHMTYGTRPLGEPVLEYLRDWLSHHILGEDQRFRPFIETSG
jgi:hemerythrin-like metal-binding protein